ncbi:IS5 family transposase [Nonomuraea jabiensis]|uniref:IS5 family transposase n=1 Tax=Nonomuraea jabiensis TaxID=882448 RepID=UPI00342209EA
MATLAVTRRFDLTDAQWARLEPLLPAPRRPGRPSRWSKRQLIDGIRWRVRVGAPWRDVPECYGSWRAVYSLFRRWQRAGIWQQILSRLQAMADARGLLGWQVGVDSTICRAHQHAAGASRHDELQSEPPGDVRSKPADHALGRSRGGLSTKPHLACEQGQRLLAVVLTAGQRGDAPQFPAVMAAIRVLRLPIITSAQVMTLRGLRVAYASSGHPRD